MMNKNYIISAGAGALLVVALGAGALTFAAGTTGTSSTAKPEPGVSGTVTAVSGNTITVSGKNGTTYTIDASAATVTKDETVPVSDIAVGDTVSAEGSVSGDSVAATSVHDGQLPQGGFGGRGPGGPGMGMMGVRGTVASINGTTLTVTSAGWGPNASTTTTYTVDASAATVMLAPTTAGSKPITGSLSDIKVGDTVMVGGTVSNDSVAAKSIMDGQFPMGGGMRRGPKPASSTPAPSTTQ